MKTADVQFGTEQVKQFGRVAEKTFLRVKGSVVSDGANELLPDGTTFKNVTPDGQLYFFLSAEIVRPKA